MTSVEVLQLPRDVYNSLSELYNRIGGLELTLWNISTTKGRIVPYEADEHETVLRQGYIKTIEVNA